MLLMALTDKLLSKQSQNHQDSLLKLRMEDARIKISRRKITIKTWNCRRHSRPQCLTDISRLRTGRWLIKSSRSARERNSSAKRRRLARRLRLQHALRESASSARDARLREDARKKSRGIKRHWPSKRLRESQQ